ncbi:MAG: Formate hydrogenlyase subunit 4 [candidate division WS2 bacterium]|nr:Formate hydrogenlyase subunit 4 [Candidatus Lithacetigena glycinireducens]
MCPVKINCPFMWVVINIAIVLLLSPLFEGIIRKMKAILHSRKGPPIHQPYLDILKLLGKDDLRTSNNILIGMAPVICLASILMVALFVPFFGVSAPLSFSGDIIILIYFVGLSVLSVVLGAASTENPYAFVGATREMMMYVVIDIIMFISLLVAALGAKSFNLSDIILWHQSHPFTFSMVIAGISFFAIMQAMAGKLPFDVPEAEQEIMEGPFIEASGPRLALFKWSFYAKQLIFAVLFIKVFIPWPLTPSPLMDFILTLTKAGVLMVLVGLIDIVNPRLRIDQALKYYTGVLVLSLVALAFAAIGV